MHPQPTNGEKTVSKWLSMGKLMTSAAALITALAMAYVAIQELKTKASESSSKAAHNELVSKLDALNRDFILLNKEFGEKYTGIQQEVKFGIASAKAQVDSVRALFTGYALASRGHGSSKTVETVKEIVKEAQDQAQKIADSSPPEVRAAPMKRSFQKPKKWEKIQQQVEMKKYNR